MPRCGALTETAYADEPVAEMCNHADYEEEQLG